MKATVLGSVLMVMSAGLASAQVPADQDHPPPVNQNAFAPPCGCDKSCCVYGSAEYLYWWTKPAPVTVPLVTTAPAGSAAAVPGAIGNPDTTTLLGNDNYRFNGESGSRLTFGVWLDDEQGCALEGTYFVLAPTSTSHNAGSTGAAGAAFLTVPFLNVAGGAPGVESTLGLAAPGAGGGTAVLSNSLFLQGAELNGLCNLYFQSNCRLDLLGGFRYLNLIESLDLTTSQNAAGGGFAITQDNFHTRNDYYGGQIGLRGQYSCWRVIVGGSAKIAFGATNEVLGITGNTQSNLAGGAVTGATAVTAGGIFSQPTNTGTFQQNQFAYAPQADLTVSYYVGSGVRIFAGYSFLYISAVARPGTEIDRGINFTQNAAFGAGALAGPARPAVAAINQSDFWAHGITAGLAFNY